MSHANFERFFKTEKQKQFGTDFFKDTPYYETWDEIDFSDLKEIDAENTFEIKAEDLIAYAEGALDDNPLMVDEKYAKKSPYDGLVPHPIFLTQISMWCIGTKDRGNWARTPGARNPGQEIEIYEPFRAGEIIHLKMRPYDRFIKRKKCYLKYRYEFYNQENVKKATWIATLILPRTREDVMKFAKGIHALEA
jgi:acyl dehydratase